MPGAVNRGSDRERSRGVHFPGAAGHGDELVAGAHEDSDRLALVSQRNAARSEVRKRRVAQTRFPIFARGLEGFAPLAERRRYAIAESHTAVVSEQVLLAAARRRRFQLLCTRQLPPAARSREHSVSAASRVSAAMLMRCQIAALPMVVRTRSGSRPPRIA
jgi:hypothetical protein